MKLSFIFRTISALDGEKSQEDDESLEETDYFLRSPKNTRRLIESITQLEEG